MNEKHKIQSDFEYLEKKRIACFDKLKEFDNQILNLKTKPNKWSIIQIIHHLYKSEQLSIVYIKRKIKDSENIKKSGTASLLRGKILEWALRVPAKLKAPKNVSDVPDFAELDEYKTKWGKLRKDLSYILENTDTKILMSNIFKHPAIGEMNIIYALKFFDAHFDHHKKQIDKIL